MITQSIDSIVTPPGEATVKARPVVLASASEARRRLLATAGIAAESTVAGVDEAGIKRSLLAEDAAPREIATALAELKAMGFSGVQNFPTVGLIDGVFRANLEETGMSYGREVDLIRLARQQDLLTTPYVFNEADAQAMAEAGADIVVCHMGLTTGGSIGAETALALADCPGLVDAWAEAALRVNPEIIVLVHGGPVAMPEDARFVLERRENCHGFYGASSMERLPTEVALTEQTKAFKALRTG